MDWSEKVLCIKCNEGGNLLVCSENGCPIAVHEGCLNCPARFDDVGCYYCPYCCYKQSVAEAHKAREYVLAKKKALLLFMDESKIAESEKHTEESKRAESYGHNEKISKADRDQSVQAEKEQKVDNTEEEKVQKDDSEGSSGSDGQDPSPKLHEEQSIGNEVDKSNQEENHAISNEEIRNQEDGGKKNQEEERVTSAACIGEKNSKADRDQSVQPEKEQKVDNAEEEKAQKDDSEVSSGSDGQISPTMNPPRNSSRRSSSATETKKVSKQPEKSPLKLGRKRKGQYWSEAEEDALKAGVAKFSKEPIVNIPWRKILLLGDKLFDASRTPSDLKDKWKRMNRSK